MTTTSTRCDVAERRAHLSELYRSVRAATRRLCEPLSAEDCMLQSMPDASPTKWHLAHTTWFFETFVLKDSIDPSYAVLFNSYYESIGAQHPRPERGLLSRPDLKTVWRYRNAVDERMLAALETLAAPALDAVELGLHHEQQHQELILTDIKHAFSKSSLLPRYGARGREPRLSGELRWHPFEGGLVWLGHGGEGFCYDNELPRHRAFVEPFLLANRLTTCGEYLAFIEDGGYRRAELWLSEGWDWLRRERIAAPGHWLPRGDGFEVFTLDGLRPLDPHEPVVHVSLYEADAYARWAGARLARESEIELAARTVPLEGNFVESGALHPRPADPDAPLSQIFGDAWEWTQSSYAPYPGYRPAPGALGEYNGKFMCNQYVLRGGSCATPQSHLRPSYRNFFFAHARWQFSGIRLARDP